MSNEKLHNEAMAMIFHALKSSDSRVVAIARSRGSPTTTNAGKR